MEQRKWMPMAQRNAPWLSLLASPKVMMSLVSVRARCLLAHAPCFADWVTPTSSQVLPCMAAFAVLTRLMVTGIKPPDCLPLPSLTALSSHMIMPNRDLAASSSPCCGCHCEGIVLVSARCDMKHVCCDAAAISGNFFLQTLSCCRSLNVSQMQLKGLWPKCGAFGAIQICVHI